MLGKPNVGWVSVRVGNYKASTSNVMQDILLECLINFNLALMNFESLHMTFDCEGWSFDLCADNNSVSIVEHKNDDICYPQKRLNLADLAKELLADTKNFFNEFVQDTCDEYYTKREIFKYKSQIGRELDALQNNILCYERKFKIK